jgi:hypothetical protein
MHSGSPNQGIPWRVFKPLLRPLLRTSWLSFRHVLPAIVLSLVTTWSFFPAAPPASAGGLEVQNGWYSQDGHVRWGYIQHNGWWRAGQRANLTRRAPVDGDVNNYTNLDVRPNRMEDLDSLTDNMNNYGYPGFEHNYGLWFDRRRDAHDTAQRTNPTSSPHFWNNRGPGAERVPPGTGSPSTTSRCSSSGSSSV